MGTILDRQLSGWYVLQVEDIYLDLDDWITSRVGRGVVFWIPKRYRKLLVDGEWKDGTELMFPGYMFVRSRDGWQAIEDGLGVELVRFGPVPRSISIKEVRRIREMEAVGQIDGGSYFDIGDHVRIRSDARTSFAGMKAIFGSLLLTHNGHSARVVVDLYGHKAVVVAVPYDHLEPCTSESL